MIISEVSSTEKKTPLEAGVERAYIPHELQKLRGQNHLSRHAWRQTRDIDEIAIASDVVFASDAEEAVTQIRTRDGEGACDPFTKYQAHRMWDDATREYNTFICRRADASWNLFPKSSVASVIQYIKENDTGNVVMCSDIHRLIGSHCFSGPSEAEMRENRIEMLSGGVAFHLVNDTIWYDPVRAKRQLQGYVRNWKKKDAKSLKKSKGKAVHKIITDDLMNLRYGMAAMIRELTTESINVHPYSMRGADAAVHSIRFMAVILDDIGGKGCYRGLKEFRYIKKHWPKQKKAWRNRLPYTMSQWLDRETKLPAKAPNTRKKSSYFLV